MTYPAPHYSTATREQLLHGRLFVAGQAPVEMLEAAAGSAKREHAQPRA